MCAPKSGIRFPHLRGAHATPLAGGALTTAPARLIVVATYPNRKRTATRRGALMEYQLPEWLQGSGSLKLVLGALLIAWFWCGVDWRKAWPVLAVGGWMPLTLIGLMSALVWSRIWPGTAVLFGFFSVPNLVWQLGGVAL